MYYYGHGSWIALVIFGAVLLIRILSSQRRRDGRQGQGPTSNSFTASRPGPPTGPSPTTTVPHAAPASGSGLAPGWFTDPTGRHAQRYWSGTEWTEHIVDDGVPGTDPPPPAPSRQTPT